MKDLAIIIPAFKISYLQKTLQSIANQTNKNFTVYLGDDCSPHDIKSVTDKFSKQLNIVYQKFDKNIGGKNLVHQWARCVELSETEKWIWLFSDDDLMDENCVEDFYSTISRKQDRFDIYRFNLVRIDENDAIIRENEAGPEEEDAETMAYYILQGKRDNAMPDHIFTRAIYEKCGGFVFTDYAQGADWATSILFSQEKGISTILPSKIYWRYSGTNISSTAHQNNTEVINGHLQFIRWMLSHFSYLKCQKSKISYLQMRNALADNLTLIAIYHYKGIFLKNSLKFFNFYHNILGLDFFTALKEVLKIERFLIPIIHKNFRHQNR